MADFGFTMLAGIIKAVANLILWAGIDSKAFQLSQSGFPLLGNNSPEGSENERTGLISSVLD
jgi:hypothetical protein